MNVNSFGIPEVTLAGAETLTNKTLTAPNISQVVFPATQSASADANTLDDYEEGTWTPAVGGTATYTTQVGRYTKIGRLVFIHCELTINVIGTGSTTTVSGLPFTVASSGNLYSGPVGYFASIVTSVTSLVAAANAGAATVKFESTAAATATMTDATVVFGNGTRDNFDLVYEV